MVHQDSQICQGWLHHGEGSTVLSVIAKSDITYLHVNVLSMFRWALLVPDTFSFISYIFLFNWQATKLNAFMNKKDV